MNNEVNKLIPNLRFPEFVDEGEWEDTTLDEVATILKGKGISKSDIAQNGSLPCIRYGELYTHYSETIHAIKSYTNLKAEDLVLSQANDVIIPASGETQIDIATASCVLQNGIALGGDLNIIRTEVNGVFLSYYLNNAKKKDIAQLAQGISVVHLYPSQLKTLVLNIPKPKEQQKIASCLSSLDQVIEAHSQKLEALKEHKKGLMQNLFPQEGEVVPKYRFPEFLGEGDWDELMLGEAVRFTSGGTPSKDNMQYWNGNIPWISASSMHDLVAEKSESNITDLAVKDGANIVQKGNILILVRGSMLFKRIPICITGTDVSFNQDVKSLELKKDIENIFFLYLLISNESHLLESVTSTGIGAGKLDTDELKNLLMKVPSDRKEQKKIASCLWNVDEYIAAQSQKIEQLKLHKKGLIQDLFPKIND